MKAIQIVMAAIFTLAIVLGMSDLILNLKEHVYIDPESLKDLRYQQDIAFQSYLSLYGKNYKDSDVFELHKNEFLKTWQKVVDQPKDSSFQIDFNHMSDWTQFEYEKVLGVYAQEELFGPIKSQDKSIMDDSKQKLKEESFNSTLDWRNVTNADMNKNKNGKRKNRNVDANIITSVKDQTLKRSCSSSYAFATVAALESLYLLENLGKPQIELSEQQFLDCTNVKRPDNSVEYQNRGCSGGYIQDSLKYATKNPIFKQRSYPYKGSENKCKNLKAFDGRSGEKDFFQLQNFQRILAQPIEVKKALNYGPVIASISANSDTFKNYKSGIIDDCDNQVEKQNHAVLIVGYDTEMFNGKPIEYFIVKNSFGVHWGEQGFAKILASTKNVCGILSDVYMPNYKQPAISKKVVSLKDQISKQQ